MVMKNSMKYNSIFRNFSFFSYYIYQQDFAKEITQTPNMPHKKIKHEKIPCESLRRATLTKRLGNIFKKSNELSVLCDAKVAVVFANERDQKLTMWPTENEATEAIEKFLSFPEEERFKKMVEQEKYLKGRADEMNGKVLKLEQKNEEMGTECLLRELMNGTKSFKELDMEQLNSFSQFAGKKITKLENRMNELDGAGSEFSYSSPNTLMDDLRKEINVDPKPDGTSSDNQESPSIYYV